MWRVDRYPKLCPAYVHLFLGDNPEASCFFPKYVQLCDVTVAQIMQKMHCLFFHLIHGFKLNCKLGVFFEK